MKGRMTDNHFEVLERKRAAMHANDKRDAALQLAWLLYDGSRLNCTRRGVAARNLAAAYGKAGQHVRALPYAHESWQIHDAHVRTSGSMDALCERGASAACVGVIGALTVLSERESEYRDYLKQQSLEYAHMALRDFELYTTLHGDKHHPLEARYLPYVSATVSVLGEEMRGRELATRAHGVAQTVERRSMSWMDSQQMNMSTLGAIVVSTMTGLSGVESDLYKNVRRIV